MTENKRALQRVTSQGLLRCATNQTEMQSLNLWMGGDVVRRKWQVAGNEKRIEIGNSERIDDGNLIEIKIERYSRV